MVDLLQRNFNNREFLDKLEDEADRLVRRTRRYLPHIARLCLVSTFIEDGFRMITQWKDQDEYLQSTWGSSWVFTWLFILVNILTQFGGSGLILSRHHVNVGVGLLMFTVVLQTFGYGVYSSVFLLRNLSLIGSLLLLLAEAQHESRSLLAGLPSSGENAPRKYILLGGRLLILLIFIAQIRLSGSWFYLLQSAANAVLIFLVAIGYKTKLCAIILVAWLTVINFYYNRFWERIDSILWDFIKYDFFQTLSVIGGLGLVVSYGPGGVSVDDYKKKW